MKKTTWLAACMAAMMAMLATGCDNGSSEPDEQEEPGLVYQDGWLLAGSTVRQYRGTETSVTTPAGVTRIGEHAFENCTGITAVTIGDGVTVIDDYAFYGCKNLATVTVPASVALIGSGAFYGCALDTVRYGGTIAQWCAVDGIGAVAGAEHVSVAGEDLTGRTSLAIPDGTKTIAARAFYYCEDLTDVTVPASVTRIGGEAFREYTALKALQFGGTKAQWQAIEGCDTVAVPCIQCSDGYLGVKDVPGYLKIYGTKVTGYTGELPENLVIPDGVTNIGEGAFRNCKDIVTVEIPAGVTEIEDNPYGNSGAFYNCTNLTSVKIGDGMTSIGKRAFYDCTSLESVEIPGSVTKIGEYAFSSCNKLTDVTYGGTLAQWYAVDDVSALMSYAKSVTVDGTDLKQAATIVIPDGVTSIGRGAFSRCENLTSVTIPDSVTEIVESAFNRCTNLTNLKIPASMTKIGGYAFYGCTALTNLTIPASVKEIGTGAFYDCTSLESVEIHGSVTEIGDEAFRGCTSLASVTIPDSVTEIGYSAFYGCENLTSVEIPGSVESIGNLAFYECTSLTSVEIPGSVTSIGYEAFYGCKSLASVTIPASVKEIGKYAFSSCNKLTDVTYGGTIAQWCAMDDVSTLSYAEHVTVDGTDLKQAATIVIPDGVTKIAKYAFSWCENLTSVTIPGSVKEIGDGAFSGCTSLASVTIPASVKSIERGAFRYCSSLTSVAYDGTQGDWRNIEKGSSIFSGTNVTEITGKDGTFTVDSDGSITE